MEKATQANVHPIQQEAQRHSSDFWGISKAWAFKPNNNLCVKCVVNSFRFSPEKCSAFALPTGWNTISKKYLMPWAVPTQTPQRTQLLPHATRVLLPLHSSFQSHLILHRTQQRPFPTHSFYSSVNSYQHRPQLFLVCNTPFKVQIKDKFS